jgi:hypothetical protein
MFRSFIFVGFVQRVQVGESIISDLLDQGIRMGWTFSKQFYRKLVDEISNRFDIKGVVQMEDGSSPGIGTDHL